MHIVMGENHVPDGSNRSRVRGGAFIGGGTGMSESKETRVGGRVPTIFNFYKPL